MKARNAQHMRLKKISYREMFVQARVPISKSPSRAQCVDEPVCFGVERGPALLAVAVHGARLARGAAGGVNESAVLCGRPLSDPMAIAAPGHARVAAFADGSESPA